MNKKIMMLTSIMIALPLTIQNAPLDDRLATLERSFNEIIQSLNQQAGTLQNLATKLQAPNVVLQKGTLKTSQGESANARVLNLEKTFNNTVLPMIKQQGELLNKLATQAMILQAQQNPQGNDDAQDMQGEMQEMG